MTSPVELDTLVSDAFLRHDATHTRSQQEAPGVSLTLVCQRQAAYRYAGVQHTDSNDDEKRAAALGTWIHAGLLPQLRRVIGGRARYEVPVQVTEWLAGTVDLWLHKERVTLDVKTCTASKLSRVRAEGADRRHMIAGHLYAHGLRQTVKGAEPERVAVLYVGRERGEHVTVEQPLDEELITEGLEWWEGAMSYAIDPDMAPIGDRKGPGLDVVCDGCPFRTRCWPGVEGAMPQSRLVQDGDILTETALADLWTATRAKAAAEREADWAKALLDATPAGQYGPWLWKRNRDTPPKPVADSDAAVEALKAAGLEVPMTERAGRRGAKTVERV